MWCLYNNHCLDIVMIIWSSINLPTVIVFPPFAIFLERSHWWNLRPRVPFHHICLCDLFSFSFTFRSIKKNTKIPRCTLIILQSIYPIYHNFYPVHLPISSAVTRKGLTTPLIIRVASICYLCAGAIHVVLHGPPTSSITLVSSLRKIYTVAVLHHPFLFGEIST